MGWLSPWLLRKTHAINPASGAGTNYQIGIKVYRTSGTDGTESVYGNTMGKVFVGTNCRVDFGDIRFTDNDGTTLLDYWIWEKEDNNYAIFWIEVKDDLSSNQTIYVYYDNNSATSMSNGEDTFIFYDSCDNFDKWTKYTSGAGNVTIVDGTFRFYSPKGSVNKEMIKTALLGTASLALHYKLKWISPNNYTWRQHLTPDNPTAPFQLIDNQHGFIDDEHPSYQNKHFMKVGGVGKFSPLIGYRDAGQWDWMELRSISGKQIILIDGVTKDTQTEAHAWGDLRILMEGGQSASTAHERYVDDIFVRKFTDPEPTHGDWGEQETINFVTNFEALSITPQLNIQIRKLLGELLTFEDSFYSKFLYRTIILRETLQLAGKLLPRARGIPVSILLPILKTVVYLITRKRIVLETKEDEG